MSRFAKSLLAAAALLCVCRAQRFVLSSGDMQSAVNSLAARFHSIRTEGLGIDSLEVKKNRYLHTSCLRYKMYLSCSESHEYGQLAAKGLLGVSGGERCRVVNGLIAY